MASSWRWRHYDPSKCWGTTHPMTQCHIPEELNPQCKNGFILQTKALKPLLNSIRYPLRYRWLLIFLEGQEASSCTSLSNNSSVMPLDVLGRTHATLKESACPPWPKGPGNPLNVLRARDWVLQLFPMNEEFPVSASNKLALITSLPFVHTVRRYYRF